MGKKSSRYQARRKDTRRREKRRSRKQEILPDLEAEVTADQAKHDLGIVTNTQEDSSAACDVRGKLKDTQEVKQNAEFNALIAECDRVREMLYEEQRKPRHIYQECARCMQRRQLKAELARQSLHARMFSGESFGSRQLLASLGCYC